MRVARCAAHVTSPFACALALAAPAALIAAQEHAGSAADAEYSCGSSDTQLSAEAELMYGSAVLHRSPCQAPSTRTDVFP